MPLACLVMCAACVGRMELNSLRGPRPSRNAGKRAVLLSPNDLASSGPSQVSALWTVRLWYLTKVSEPAPEPASRSEQRPGHLVCCSRLVTQPLPPRNSTTGCHSSLPANNFHTLCAEHARNLSPSLHNRKPRASHASHALPAPLLSPCRTVLGRRSEAPVAPPATWCRCGIVSLNW